MYKHFGRSCFLSTFNNKAKKRKYKLEFTAEYNLKKQFYLANEEPTRSVSPPASVPSH